MEAQATKRMLQLQTWANQVDACNQSGLSVKIWCNENGINEKTYYRRRQIVCKELLETGDYNQRRPESVVKTETTMKPLMIEAVPSFVSFPLPEVPKQGTMARIQLSNGHSIEIVNGADLSRISDILKAVSVL